MHVRAGSAVSPAELSARARGALLFLLVGAGYVAGYELAVRWFSTEDQGASFFPAAGVTLAALVLVRRREWPVVLAAAAIAEYVLDVTSGIGGLASAGYTLANVAQPLVGALLLTTFVPRPDLSRTRDLAAFVGSAVLFAPVVGGVIAATIFVFVDDRSGWGRFALEWWSGDGLGVLVVGGALLCLRTAVRPSRWRLVEGIVLGGLAIAATALVFEIGRFEFVYIPAALLVVIAFRLGTTGVAVTSALVAFVAAGATAEALDFWDAVDISPANRILYLQLALGLLIAALLGLAAEIAERERIAVELARTESERAAAVELATLAESERAARARTERLQALTAALSAAASVSDVLETVVVRGVATLEGDSGAVAVPADGGASFEIVASRGYDAETLARWSRFPADLDVPVSRAAAERRVVLVDSLADAAAAYPGLGWGDYPGDLPDRAAAAAPLVGTTGRVLAVVYVAFHRVRAFDPGDREMLVAVARQGAQALERALAFEAELAARRRAELLEGHASRLAAATTVGDVARATVSGLEPLGVGAAWMHLARNGSLEVVAAAGPAEAVPAEGAQLALDADAAPAGAARSGLVVAVSTRAELAVAYPRAAAGRPGHGLGSLVSVPLVATGGRTLGVLTLASSEERWPDGTRTQVIGGLAEQCGLALERAQLQAEADAAAADAALLALLGEVLERATTMEERARALVRALTPGRAAFATVHALGEGGSRRLLARAESADASAIDERVLDRLAGAAVSSNDPARESAGGLRLIAVPLRARDRALGVLTVGARSEARPGMTAVLAQRIATRAALAFDNALLYEQERDVSHSLQMGLLGGPLAVTADTAIASAYRPGTATLEVGGDWYDAFTLPGGRLAFLVGDVVGHGLDAAVAMGQLRGAVRALAPLGPPHEVLEGLDLFVEQLPAAAMATVAYAELDTETGRLAYACAGHPPPLLLPAEGEPRLLWDGRSTPLGSWFAEGRTEAVEQLEPGDTIVLYTDGLVERRDEGISAGLDALPRVAAGARSDEPASVVDRLLEAFLANEARDDDVCVLAVRRVLASGLRFVHTFPASPAEVTRLRHAFALWLEDVDLDAERRADAILALAEAAANAAEHAYGFDGTGVVRVQAWVVDGELHLSVRDQGTWRQPTPGGDRGRGRTIMEALMRDVTIDPTTDGTLVRMSMPIRSSPRGEPVP